MAKADFISKLVEDPAAPPEAVIIAGYQGDSSEEEHTRLYISPDLSVYFEIPKEAVLHAEKIPNDPLGAVYAWIEKGTELIRRGADGEESKSTS